MSEIVRYVRDFLREQWNAPFFLLHAAFYGAAVWLNYAFDVERAMVRTYAGTWILPALYVPYYALPLLFTIFTYAHFYRRPDVLRSRYLWMLVAAALVILSVNGGFHSFVLPIRHLFPQELQYFVLRCLNNVKSATLYFALVSLIWYFRDRRVLPLYGVTSESFHPRPFFQILALLVPVIAAASFQSDFLESYPRFTNRDAADYLGIHQAVPVGFFELCYGLDFVATEFFFRGFMVLAFARSLGPAAVFPMVSAYLFLHFEKPAAEALSSIIGGFVLGVIAYRTRSILGGVILHLGVAWTMETAAYLQRLAR